MVDTLDRNIQLIDSEGKATFAFEDFLYKLAFSGTAVADADYGDITVSGSGSVWTIDDPTLAALKNYNTNGLLTQTAADTFTGRTITGTANQVTVTNGNGVSGNPTLSLPQDIATTSNPQFATIELGAATDTTISRASAGRIAVEGSNLAFTSEAIDAYVWITVTAGTPSVTSSSANVSSVTDRAVGKFTINFGTALASADYVGAAMGINAEYTVFEDIGVGGGSAHTTTAFYVSIYLSGAYRDMSFMTIFTGA